MKRIQAQAKRFILALGGVLLVGCTSGTKTPAPPIDVAAEPQRGGVEKVGVLVVVEPEDCLIADGCGPRFSLAEADMRTRTMALNGELPTEWNGHLIAVKGAVTALPKAQKARPGYGGFQQQMQVKKALSITNYSVPDMLRRSASEFAQKEFGCEVHWDKRYTWRLDGRRPYLSVIMSKEDHQNGRFAKLWLDFDGSDQKLLHSSLIPVDATVCRR